MRKFFTFSLAEEEDISKIINSSCHSITASAGDKDRKGRVTVVNCLNPHSFVTAMDDEQFRVALEKSDLLLPDGIGICMSMKKYKGIDLKKIAGDDLHKMVLEVLDGREGSKVYYMGSTPEVLGLIESRLKREHPTIEVRSWSPSFCEELPREESLRIIEDINIFAPDVLFVSMTAPKQEKWVERYRSLLTTTGLVASIGAVFDFYSGTVKRASPIVVKMRMEWLVRLVKEPRRMWQRNFVSTPRYLRYVRKHRGEM